MIRNNITEAAEFLRVTEEQLAEWREAGTGPEYTALRCGGFYYDTRDMKQWLRDQLEARRAAAGE